MSQQSAQLWQTLGTEDDEPVLDKESQEQIRAALKRLKIWGGAPRPPAQGWQSRSRPFRTENPVTWRRR
jgi:hypothetical protein